MSSDVVVAGGGVFGVTAALELRARGHRVTIVDPGPIPHPDAASTDVSKVIRMDYGVDDFYFDLMTEAMAGWDAWNERWGETVYHESGALWMSRAPMAPGGFEHECLVRLEARGLAPERLDSAALAARFPAWAADRYPDGYLNRRAGWARSGRVVALLAQKAGAAGVEIRSARFERFAGSAARVTGVVLSDGREIAGDTVIVAAGAWTHLLVPSLTDVMWATGQPVLHFRVDRPREWQPPRFPVWGADTSNTGWYGFPALDDGTLKVANHGEGRRVDPDDPRKTTPADEERFRAFLAETFPAAAEAPVIHRRLCLYSDTWDGDFWIDRDPEREGLVVAAGGSGHGFKFAPVLGAITADVVERVENPWAHRFAWRERGALRTEHARNA